jgi:hypothetical protein
LESQEGAHLDPFYWRNDYVVVEQWNRNIVRDPYVHPVALHQQRVSFAWTWDVNLRIQGFAEAFTDKSILGWSAPLEWTRAGDVPLRDPSPFNRLKGALHHEDYHHELHRIPQCALVTAERI